jgi:hypothetical protein
MMGQYLSMPDPCPHITRMMVIAARLNGEEMPTCDCKEVPITHTISTTRDRVTAYCKMPLIRLRCTCGWHSASPNRRDAHDLKIDHLDRCASTR